MKLEVQDLDAPDDLWISSMKRARSAYDQSVVYVRARNPRVFRKGVAVRVSIRADGKRLQCETRCNVVSLSSAGLPWFQEPPV